MGKMKQIEPVNSYEYFDDYTAPSFYHGTSDIFPISFIYPAIETGNLREEWRKSFIDKVFMTNSIFSAERYAKKAATKFGGNPIVYIVHPIGDVWQVNATEFVANAAEILSALSK